MAEKVRTREPKRSPERRPVSTEEAHRAIRDTRGRIARDLDAIEARIQRQKQRVTRTTDKVRSRLEALEPARDRIRSHPWTSLGTALSAGAVLGAVTGGAEPEPIDEEEREKRRHWKRERRERLRGPARPAAQQPAERRGVRAREGGRGVLGELGRALMSGLAARAKRSASRTLRGGR